MRLVPRTEFSYAWHFSVAVAQKVVCSGAVGLWNTLILEPPICRSAMALLSCPWTDNPITQYELFRSAISLFRMPVILSGHRNFPEAPTMIGQNSNSPIATIQADSLKSHAHILCQRPGKTQPWNYLGHDDDDSGDGLRRWLDTKTNVGVDITQCMEFLFLWSRTLTHN